MGTIVWVPTACLAVLPSAAFGASGSPLEEIVVTAEKRRAPASDLPMSLVVLSGEALESLGAMRPADLARLLPNVAVHETMGNGNPAIVIRGVGLQDYNANAAPSVGLYIDEVYQPSIAMADLAFFDLASVEILKGPQGSIWGRNTIAGAVIIRSASPSRDPLVEATIGTGSYRDVRGSLVVNGPIGATAAGRLAVFADDQGDGWFENRFRDQSTGEFQRSAARVQLGFTPSRATRINVALNAELQRGDAYQPEHIGLVGPECPISNLPPGIGERDDRRCSNIFSGYKDAYGDPDTGEWSLRPRVDNTGVGAWVRVEHDLDPVSFTSLTSWHTFDLRHEVDADASPLRFIDLQFGSQIDSVAQEVRLNSNDNEALTWLAGIIVARDSHQETRFVDTTDFLPGVVDRLQLTYDQTVTSYAVFGQADYAMTLRTSLTAGLRYTSEDFDFSGGTSPVPGHYNPDTLSQVFPGVPSFVDQSKVFDDVSGRIAVSHHPRDDLLVYGSLSRGFKAGGVFGGFGLSPEAFTPYEPESIVAAEIGTKWRAANARIEADAAVFHYDYRDLQAVTLVSYPFGAIPQLTNIGAARIVGGDLNITIRPTSSVEVSLQVGGLDTEITSSASTIDSLQRPVELKGNELARAPAVSALSWISYTRAATKSLSWRVMALAHYTGGFYSDLQNQRHLTQTAMTTFDAGVWVWSSSGDWKVTILGENLTDERPIGYASPSAGGNDFIFVGEPRRWMLELRRRW